MKRTILLLLTISIGLSFSTCKNSKRNKADVEKNEVTLLEINNESIETDTLKEFIPGKREMQFIYDGFFNIPELFVAQSPDKPKAIQLKESETVISFDVSPAGLIVATIIKDANRSNIRFWQIDQSTFFDSIEMPEGVDPMTVAWHPQANALFLVASIKDRYSIIRYEKEGDIWKQEEIFSSKFQINRLILCPRPFLIYYDSELRKYLYSYRIFFGIQKDDGTYRIASVTEFGKKFYQVVGPSSSFTHSEFDEIDPSQLEADWALPVAFHPSGQDLIWENSSGNFFTAQYNRAWFEGSSTINNAIKGGQLSPTPNGLGLFHWQEDVPGVNLFLFAKGEADPFIQTKELLASPISTVDGKGIICITKSKNLQSLEYIQLDYPLSDVVNSWMFAESLEDIELLSSNFGLFRPLRDDQIYQLYESENYYCNDYDQSTPTRPYFVTTDIFWELYGSAFQGIFTVKERVVAIPAFWSFVKSASKFLNDSSAESPWTEVFRALISLENNDLSNSEVKRIINSTEKIYSDVLNKEYDYSQLKPLGIYSSTSQMQLYYRAFKYLTTAFENDKRIVSQLNNLPVEIRENAFVWIDSYNEFISKPRRQNVFSKGKFTTPRYVQYPDTGLSVFPLSWGMDNEILNSVVFHSNYPDDKKIISKSGGLRLHPSGLDLAASISSNFASRLLENEYKEYPNLRPVIQNLRRSFETNSTSSANTLYDQWINALAEQWIDTLKSTNRDQGDPIWQVKRLQTGLASWATLRHATVLVNETGAAECGEAGFEEILMRAPRGSVEPDPYTLEAIAKLFEATIKYLPVMNEADKEYKTLYEGIERHLKETANEIRFFKKIAEKEIRGESLTNAEYEAILYVARIAEHKFLIFKSLANLEYALARPDPMPKITNVFGNAQTSYLMAAVGRPLEWDFIVPFFGRKQLVKGSVYSYYEFVNDNLMDNNEWLKQLPSQEFLPWVKPYISEQRLSFPPKCDF